MLGLGWLHETNVDAWRHGQVEDLEYFLPVPKNRLIDLLVYLDEWATGHGLRCTEAEYVSATRARRQLRFSPGPIRRRRPPGGCAGWRPT